MRLRTGMSDNEFPQAIGIGRDQIESPNIFFDYGELDFEIRYRTGSTEWTVTQVSTGAVLEQNLELPFPGLDLSRITRFGFAAYTTTNSTTWGDDLTVSCNFD